MKLKSRRWIVAATFAVAALALPASGLAANPSAPGGEAAATQGVLSSQASGSLPFTGMNLAFIVIGGLVLLATGLLLRRRSRSTSN